MRPSCSAVVVSVLAWGCGEESSNQVPIAPDAARRDACVGCPGPRLVGSWGGFGTEPGQFIEPSSVELRGDGAVIVAGHEDRFQIFSRDGELIDIIGTSGAGDGQFNHPHGLAVDRARDDLVYIGDQENGRLQVFDSDGEFVRQWGDAGFQHIHDVGIDRATGDIFVGDFELDTLRKFSRTGDLLGDYGGPGTGPGQFNAVWGVSTDSGGFVYVADTSNRRIQKLDSDGAYVTEWSDAGGVAFVKPTGVYVDENDLVYVCDSLAETVSLFDTDGQHVETWDLRAILGERSEPEDLVIDTQTGDTFVAEVFGHRVLHLLLDLDGTR